MDSQLYLTVAYLLPTLLTAFAYEAQAAQRPKGGIERLLLVAAFAVSPYAAAKHVRAPMYPLLGETFELVIPEKHVRFIAETVGPY